MADSNDTMPTITDSAESLESTFREKIEKIRDFVASKLHPQPKASEQSGIIQQVICEFTNLHQWLSSLSSDLGCGCKWWYGLLKDVDHILEESTTDIRYTTLNPFNAEDYINAMEELWSWLSYTADNTPDCVLRLCDIVSATRMLADGDASQRVLAILREFLYENPDASATNIAAELCVLYNLRKSTTKWMMEPVNAGNASAEVLLRNLLALTAYHRNTTHLSYKELIDSLMNPIWAREMEDELGLPHLHTADEAAKQIMDDHEFAMRLQAEERH